MLAASGSLGGRYTVVAYPNDPLEVRVRLSYNMGRTKPGKVDVRQSRHACQRVGSLLQRTLLDSHNGKVHLHYSQLPRVSQ